MASIPSGVTRSQRFSGGPVHASSGLCRAVLAAIISGRPVDRFGTRVILLVGLVLYAASSGGVLNFLSIELEGTNIVRRFNARGVIACVLKYRGAQTETRKEDFVK